MNQIDSIITAGLKIEGSITGVGSLIVEGEIIGDIRMQQDVMVRDCGVIEADIRADNVNVNGKVNGNITATSFIFISGNSKVIGDVTGPSINIEKGAKFRGNLRMGELEDAD